LLAEGEGEYAEEAEALAEGAGAPAETAGSSRALTLLTRPLAGLPMTGAAPTTLPGMSATVPATPLTGVFPAAPATVPTGSRGAAPAGAEGAGVPEEAGASAEEALLGPPSCSSRRIPGKRAGGTRVLTIPQAWVPKAPGSSPPSALQSVSVSPRASTVSEKGTVNDS
jgi:hypothetical protein